MIKLITSLVNCLKPLIWEPSLRIKWEQIENRLYMRIIIHQFTPNTLNFLSCIQLYVNIIACFKAFVRISGFYGSSFDTQGPPNKNC